MVAENFIFLPWPKSISVDCGFKVRMCFNDFILLWYDSGTKLFGMFWIIFGWFLTSDLKPPNMTENFASLAQRFSNKILCEKSDHISWFPASNRSPIPKIWGPGRGYYQSYPVCQNHFFLFGRAILFVRKMVKEARISVPKTFLGPVCTKNNKWFQGPLCVFSLQGDLKG